MSPGAQPRQSALQCGDTDWVEGRVGVLLHDFEHLVQRKRIAVGALGRQDIEGVSDRDDLHFWAQLSQSAPVGVALAVKSLMMTGR